SSSSSSSSALASSVSELSESDSSSSSLADADSSPSSLRALPGSEPSAPDISLPSPSSFGTYSLSVMGGTLEENRLCCGNFLQAALKWPKIGGAGPASGHPPPAAGRNTGYLLSPGQGRETTQALIPPTPIESFPTGPGSISTG